MANSINTNVGAQIALQNLNATNRSLETTQNRINTGMKIATAKDNGAIWSIAQGQRAESQALNSVNTSLKRGQSTIDVALAAGESISDVLVQMKELALQASDSSLSDSTRSALNEDFVALRDSITGIIDNAEFDGSNLLAAKPTAAQSTAFTTAKTTFGGTKTTYDTATTTYGTAKTAYDTAKTTYDAAEATYQASAKDTAADTARATAVTNWGTAQATHTTAATAFGTAGTAFKTATTTYKTAQTTFNTTAAGEGGYKALGNAKGTSTLAVTQQNLALGGASVTVSDVDSLIDFGGDAKGSKATALLSSIDDSIKNVSTALAKLGTASKSFGNHVNFTGKLQDALDAGIGNLVDADLAKESAKLTALQTKQQLGVQALSIANQSSSVLLGLFR